MNTANILTYPDMLTAIDAGDIEKIQQGLDQGIKIEYLHFSLLTIAVYQNKLDVVNFLISKGADVNYPSSNAASPLVAAAQEGNVEIAKILLDHGAKADQVGTYFSALHTAAAEGQLEIIKLFVERGVNVNLNSADEVPVKPIVCAAEGGHTEIVKFLANNGASVKTFDPSVSQGESHLIEAADTSVLFMAILSKDQSMIDFLISKNADLNLGFTLAHYDAVQGVPINYLNYLNHSDINAVDVIGLKPIHYAILSDHDVMVNVFAKNGADLNEPIKFSEEDFLMPVHLAVNVESPKSLKYLLDHGVNVNVVDSEGETPLHGAMFAEGAQAKDLINILLAHGANVNSIDQNGDTPLHSAVYSGNAEAIKMLLAHGADASIKNSAGKDALEIAQDYAKYGYHADCADAFLSNTTQPELTLTMEDVFSSQDSDFIPQLERVEVQQNYMHPELDASAGIEYF